MKEYNQLVSDFCTGSENYFTDNFNITVTSYNLFMIGYQITEKNYSIRRKDFDNYLLTVTEKGEGILEYDNKVIPLKENDLVMIDCNKPHVFRNKGKGKWKICYMHVTGPSLGALYDKFVSYQSGNVFHNYPIEEFIAYAQYLLTKLRNCDKKLIEFNYFINLIDENLVNEVSDVIYKVTRNIEKNLEINHPIYPKSIENVINYLHTNFDKDINLNTLAGIAQLSKYHFLRLFYQYVNTTPIHYLNTIRLERAKNYLLGTNYSVKKIAYEVGFHSLQPLNNLFKERLGLTPSEYRKKILSDNRL